MTGTHWLVRILERAEVDGGVSLELPPTMPAPEAWEQVTRSSGLSDSELTEMVAQYFRLSVADLDGADPELAGMFEESVAYKHLIVPLRIDGRQVVVATCDPTDLDMERIIGFGTGKTAVFEIASPGAIKDAINRTAQGGNVVETLLSGMDGGTEDALQLVQEMGPESITEGDASATPVVKLSNLIIREGIAQGASDIHLEPGRKLGSVRYRVDGVLRKHTDLPMAALNRVISRIKITADMDIADRLRPQDGRLRVSVDGEAYDLRISTLPADRAEKCVIRILASNQSFSLDDLGQPAPELARLRSLLKNREGIVLVTGPTGSGKTTTLYAALQELATGAVNIMTVEDPIEYELGGVTQTHVKVKQGMTFGKALRAILRQDPDVILVGEIRDGETAEVAAQAARTGHLVLATVHANDAVAAVSRLTDIGLNWATVADTLHGALAQRLLRKVCPDCAEAIGKDLSDDERMLSGMYGTRPLVRAVGCSQCGFTGYRGRLPVVEVMVMNPKLEEAIGARKGHATLHRLAVEGGMRTMHQVALDWVTAGETTLVEVERVLGHEGGADAEEDDLGPTRVLLVDDDENIRVMLGELLKLDGYEVETAEDGTKGLEMLRSDPGYSLVVLDLDMPGLTGKEVLRQIRDSVETSAIPVLINTGIEKMETEVELLEAGADDYVQKTAGVERFLARVHAVLRRAKL